MSSWINRYDNQIEIEDFIGKVFNKIENIDNEIKFYTEDIIYIMYHEQDCCESVYVEDVNGDLDDLLNTPILIAEEVISSDYQEFQEKSEWDESFTWTFYKFATIKGYVTIRWYGISNGYYSESVSLCKESI